MEIFESKDIIDTLIDKIDLGDLLGIKSYKYNIRCAETQTQTNSTNENVKLVFTDNINDVRKIMDEIILSYEDARSDIIGKDEHMIVETQNKNEIYFSLEYLDIDEEANTGITYQHELTFFDLKSKKKIKTLVEEYKKSFDKKESEKESKKEPKKIALRKLPSPKISTKK
jgi:hypothetical protein